jgi:hypothetical protein
LRFEIWDLRLRIEDWGLGIGDWELGILRDCSLPGFGLELVGFGFVVWGCLGCSVVCIDRVSFVGICLLGVIAPGFAWFGIVAFYDFDYRFLFDAVVGTKFFNGDGLVLHFVQYSTDFSEHFIAHVLALSKINLDVSCFDDLSMCIHGILIYTTNVQQVFFLGKFSSMSLLAVSSQFTSRFRYLLKNNCLAILYAHILSGCSDF